MSSAAIDEASVRVFHRARSFAGAAVLSIALAGGAVAACGGTTGRDDVAGPPTVGSVSADVGFDVDIEYADAARLPHFAPSEAGGAEAGAPPWDLWPQCAPDGIDPATGEVLLDDAGSPLIYNGYDPDASTWVDRHGQCASQVWTTNAACDLALRLASCDDPTGDSYFPPCSNLPRDASAPGALAAGGPGKGALKYDLCGSLYTCILDYFSATGLVNRAVITAFCGLDDAGKVNNPDCQKGLTSGPCHDAFEKALESTDPTYIFSHVTTTGQQGLPGNEGREAAIPINCILAVPTSSSICFGDAGAAAGH
jgi:hypothetical protein